MQQVPHLRRVRHKLKPRSLDARTEFASLLEPSAAKVSNVSHPNVSDSNVSVRLLYRLLTEIYTSDRFAESVLFGSPSPVKRSYGISLESPILQAIGPESPNPYLFYEASLGEANFE